MNQTILKLIVNVGIVVIVIATVFFGFKYWLARHDAAVATAAAIQQAQKTGEATSGIAGDASDGIADATATDHVVTESRVTFHHAYAEAKRESPDIADWSDDIIDVRLRDLARERRLARERSGDSEVGSRGDAPQSRPGWRGGAGRIRNNE